MTLLLQDAEKAQSLLRSASCLSCLCHRNPDGDAIGSLLGMGLLLEQQFPEKEILLHCYDPAPPPFRFLPGALRVTSLLGLPKGKNGRWDPDRDAFIFLDSAEPKLTEFHESHPELFNGTFRSLNLDHHSTNINFASLNIVMPDASSTCEVIVKLADALRWKLTPDIATCLLTGVYTDTGGLLHSNTTADVYRTIAELLRCGARRQEIVTNVFRSAKLSTLRLWGRVLEKISVTDEGGAVSAVTEGDFRATGADYSELTGAIDFVNAVPGVRFSMVLSERNGKVKGSLRTLRNDVDVSAMAGAFKGGGHKKAAGFSLSGKLKPEIRWKVVENGNGNGKKIQSTPAAE